MQVRFPSLPPPCNLNPGWKSSKLCASSKIAQHLELFRLHVPPLMHSLRLTCAMCSYHGWQFDGAGKLKDIPQADNEKTLEMALKSQRSCCQVYPCQV